ncbi:hypothetical protein [Micromonospora haikouensis]|uniref:hypothetical protein n=1 Tax=Micromonospora haikouensis TaxID=686309 RepID=UPI003D738E77
MGKNQDWALHPPTGFLLQELGVIDDQHPGRVAEVLDYLIADIVTDGVDVAARLP